MAAVACHQSEPPSRYNRGSVGCGHVKVDIGSRQRNRQLRSLSPEAIWRRRLRAYATRMTQLEQIEDLFDGIGENMSPEEGPIRLARLSVTCARGLQILASAVDVLAEKLDGLDHSTDSIDPVEVEARFADLNAQLAEMAKRIKKLSKKI